MNTAEILYSTFLILGVCAIAGLLANGYCMIFKTSVLARRVRGRFGTIVIALLLTAFGVMFLTAYLYASIRSISEVERRAKASRQALFLQLPVAEIEEEPVSEPLEGEALYRSYAKDICKLYPNVEPEMVEAIIYHESRFQPNAKNYNGTCVGLMQLSTKWHTDRANSLGVTDLFDPYGNILTGVDYLSQLVDTYEDPALVLMMYHMRHDRALELYRQGVLSDYTKSVLAMMEDLKKGES